MSDHDKPEPALPIGTEFTGAITLQDWIPTPRGIARVFVGKIRCMSDEEAVGFRAQAHDRWLAIVSGPRDHAVVLGCQIRAVWQMPLERARQMPDSYDLTEGHDE